MSMGEWLMEGNGEPFPVPDNGDRLSPAAGSNGIEARNGEAPSFDRLLSEISAKYINLASEEIEEVLKEDFRRLCRVLQLDKCNLYVRGEDPHGFYVKNIAWYVDESEVCRRLAEWDEQHPVIRYEGDPYIFDTWRRGQLSEPVAWERVDETLEEEVYARQLLLGLGVKSNLSVPIAFAGSIVGAFNASTLHAYRTWPDDLISRLRLFGEVFINAFMHKRSEGKLKQALAEIKELKDQLEADYHYLKEELDLGKDFSGIIGESDAFKKVLLRAKQVAPTDATVLILGETGTGKGLIARAIHNAGKYRDRPMVQVNCAALAPTLIESELFGHEKGAYTGAATQRIGRFETANGTTLFLDEIGDLPLELQPKLLRVLEEGEFERVGGSRTIHTNVRLIAATSKDLEKEIEAGRFRSDLWYRLNLIPIVVPPLRERVDDIPLFLNVFLDTAAKLTGRRFHSPPLHSIKSLQTYSWPGNVRELKNLIERAVITSLDGHLQFEIPRPHVKSSENSQNLTALVKNIEREKILKALEDSNWVVDGPNGAAWRLGFTPSTLRYKMKKLNIKRSRLPE